jgi:hypothetical protein
MDGEPGGHLGCRQRPEQSSAVLVDDTLLDSLDANGEARHDDGQEAVVETGGHLVIARRMTGTLPVSVQLCYELLVPASQLRQQPADLVGRGLDAVALGFVMQPEQ